MAIVNSYFSLPEGIVWRIRILRMIYLSSIFGLPNNPNNQLSTLGPESFRRGYHPTCADGQQLGNSENVDIVLKNFFDLDLPAWNLSISRSFPRFLLMGVEPWCFGVTRSLLSFHLVSLGTYCHQPLQHVVQHYFTIIQYMRLQSIHTLYSISYQDDIIIIIIIIIIYI